MPNIPKIEYEPALKTLCKKNFWEFCVYISPEFYTENRPHLKILCQTLQAFYNGNLLKEDGTPYKKLAISIPPRHGKSRTLELFSIWVFGKNNSEKIMTITYNEFLSVQFSKSVRDKILTEKSNDSLPVVSDVFDISIKQGSGASHLWALEGQHLSYLGGSPGGTLTGIGATVLIVDDLIKNAIEALNARVLQEHWDFYNNTLRQRLEEGHIQIVNFTRWATGDLIGKLLKEQKNEWYVLKMEAMTDGVMLCDELLSRESYEEIKRGMMKEIFFANYHQKPMDIEGRLYKSLKTYKDKPNGVIKNYTDTADEGNCYLCSICYVAYKNEAFVVDVLYTGAGMEVTEGQTAEMFISNNVNEALIESNNGGKGFARAVVREMQDRKNNKTVVRWFNQNKNKTARILSGSAWVQEHIYFPENWSELWPEFFRDVNTFTKDGKGQKEDAPDVLTGIAEQFNKQTLIIF
jgi:predicted phage terminase large subunit-like protein